MIYSIITNDYIFNSAVGITKDELKRLLNHYNLNKELNIGDWYNNYKFNKDVKDTISND